ncbi:MAG: PAS domain S-box protein [Methanomicrobiaceae archaeon]|nr:PAS domain S-box protein [Methanomicrobiaceae archaeon]
MNNNPSILISGDNAITAELKGLMNLKNPEFLIETAASAKNALKAASEKRYDVIISFPDISGINGLKLSFDLTENKISTPFILIYQVKDEAEIIKALSDGSEFYVQELKTPEKLSLELLEKINSITGKKESEILCKPEERAVAYFQKSPEGIFVADNTGKYIDVNPSACRITGYTREELLKKSIPEILSPSSLPDGVGAFKKVLKTGHEQGEFLFTRKDGSNYYMSVNATRAGPDEIVAFCRDVTDERKARQYLKESEERYRSLFEGVPDYILVHREGKILFVNPAVLKLLEMDKSDIIGKDLIGFVAEKSHKFVISMMKKRKKGETLPTYEITVNTKYGPRITEVNGSNINYEGKPASLIVLTDITEKRHSEEYANLLSKMSDGAPASIIVHEFDGKIIYANKEALRLHGFTRREFRALNLYDLDVIESNEQLNERIKSIDKTGELDYDTEHFRKDGSKIPLHINVKIMDWEGRKILLNISTDLTERKKSERLLKEKNLFLQQLIDTIPNPIFYKDSEGKYLGCNKAFEEYTGLLKEKVIGKTVYELFPKDIADIYKEHDQNLFDNPGMETYESVIKYIDGSIKNVIFYKATYNDIKGSLAGLVGIILDISERKKMEEALKKSEEKFKSYVESAREGIFVVDTSGNILDVNPGACDLLGYTRDELLNSNVSSLVPAEDIEYVMKRFEETAKTGHISDEFRTKRKDGEIVPVIISAVLMPDGNLLAIHTNIYELKRAEEGVKEANKKLNLLGSITRHDILNQLTAVLAYLEIIEIDGDIPKGSKTEKYLSRISDASETIKKQILFTKDYSDLGEQAPKWQNVRKIVDDTYKIQTFESIILENRLEDVEIFADPLFEKVIYNLFDNALKHGEKISKIRFEFIKSPDGATLICEDDGMGVPEDFKEKIFNREHYTNTGLGLFLSGEILSITKMTIRETGVYGKGARFEISVPEGMYRQ